MVMKFSNSMIVFFTLVVLVLLFELMMRLYAPPGNLMFVIIFSVLAIFTPFVLLVFQPYTIPLTLIFIYLFYLLAYKFKTIHYKNIYLVLLTFFWYWYGWLCFSYHAT